MVGGIVFNESVYILAEQLSNQLKQKTHMNYKNPYSEKAHEYHVLYLTSASEDEQAMYLELFNFYHRNALHWDFKNSLQAEL